MAIDVRDPSPEYLDFWREYHLCTLTTPRPNGTPHVVAVGATYDPEAGLARVITNTHSRKAAHVRVGGDEGVRVAICQVSRGRWATLEGVARVVEDEEAVAEAVRRYAERYQRTPAPNPDRIAIEVTLTRAMGNVRVPAPRETTLTGERVTLRTATRADIPALVAIRETPEVYGRWRGGEDLTEAVSDDLANADSETLVVLHEGDVVGAIQWYSEDEPDYRHAGMDLYLSPTVHGRGLGTDSVRTLARHLFDEHGFHRLVIDPAADNAAALACYRKVGFQPVGTMRQYERDVDGKGWHDGLLLDLLADELT